MMGIVCVPGKAYDTDGSSMIKRLIDDLIKVCKPGFFLLFFIASGNLLTASLMVIK